MTKNKHVSIKMWQMWNSLGVAVPLPTPRGRSRLLLHLRSEQVLLYDFMKSPGTSRRPKITGNHGNHGDDEIQDETEFWATLNDSKHFWHSGGISVCREKVPPASYNAFKMIKFCFYFNCRDLSVHPLLSMFNDNASTIFAFRENK